VCNNSLPNPVWIGGLRLKCNGAKIFTEDARSGVFTGSVEERSHRAEAQAVRLGGALRSENVGMSNELIR